MSFKTNDENTMCFKGLPEEYSSLETKCRKRCCYCHQVTHSKEDETQTPVLTL